METVGSSWRVPLPLWAFQAPSRMSSLFLCLALAVLLTVLFGSEFISVNLWAMFVGIILFLGVVAFFCASSLLGVHEQHWQTAKVLDSTDRHFQFVFENALDTILVCDDQGVCHEANPAAQDLLGLPPSEFIGQRLSAFYKNPIEFENAWTRLLRAKRQQGHAELVRKDHSTIFVEFSAKAECLPSRHVMILRDMTQRRHAEEQVAKNLELAESAWVEADALRKATLALTQDLRMDYVLDTLLDSLGELVPYAHAHILLREADSRMFMAREAPRDSKKKPTSKYPMTLDADDFPILQRVLATQAGALISDAKREEGWRTLKGHSDLRSWIFVPLVASQQVLGILSVGHASVDSFTAEHLRLAKLIAIPAAAAIQNARLYECAEIYGEELERRISDLRQAQSALKESEEKFQTIFRSSPIAFSISTLNEGKFLEVNTAFEQRYGYARAELIGRTAQQVGLWENLAERPAIIEQIRSGQSVRKAVRRFRTKSGEVILTAFSADTIHLDGQTCMLAVSDDVAERPQTAA
jgi:PAS domain S-box-containing protein